jgi:hypothetical protein
MSPTGHKNSYRQNSIGSHCIVLPGKKIRLLALAKRIVQKAKPAYP